MSDNPKQTSTSLTLAGAITAALRDAMRDDPNVLVFGEDVGRLGGVFRITDGIQEEFGEARCFDTPICEAGILGAAIGMAMAGLRPVVEMQFDAFAYPAFEQMVSQLAKMRNRTRGTLTAPVVIRVPYGGGVGAVEHHSDSSEAYTAHTPGLHVATPATPADAYDLLRDAIRSDDPVVFFEPKKLYWKSSPISPQRTRYGLGSARVMREGEDVTLISYGPTTPLCLEAADFAFHQGYSVGVIDLRSIVPLDISTVVDQVASTGRAVVVHESVGFAGIGAEIVSQVTERCFPYLEAPVGRVTGLDIPYPPPRLEHLVLPNVDRILTAVIATFDPI